MNTYDISDITDRLEDLDAYLDDLENSLESARDARSDMAEYAEQIGNIYHLLSLVASSQGLTVEEYVSSTLSRLFKSLADLQGIQPAPQVTPEQVTTAPSAPPQPPHKLTRAERRAAAAAPTAEQAAELARQLAEHGGTAAVAADPLSVRAPGYDPEFTPDPENFGKLEVED